MILFTSYSVPGRAPSIRDIFGIVPANWPILPICDWTIAGTPVRTWSNHGMEVANILAAPHNTEGPSSAMTVEHEDAVLIDYEPRRPNYHKHQWRAIVYGMLARYPSIEPVCYGLAPFTGARGLPATSPVRLAEEGVQKDMDDVLSDIASSGGSVAIDVYPHGGYTEGQYRHWFESRYEAAMGWVERHGCPLWLIGGVRYGNGDYYSTPSISEEAMSWQVDAMRSHSGPCAVWAPLVDERSLSETPQRLGMFASLWGRNTRTAGTA